MRLAGLFLFFPIFASLAAFAQDNPAADRQRIQELRAKRDRGDKLTDDDRVFIQRMTAQRQGRQPGPAADITKGADPSKWKGLVPLTDMSGTYHGEDGGLYGHGRNELPATHRDAYLHESQEIKPRDADGRQDPKGKIGLITIGFSNTNMESITFKALADADPQKSPNVVVVNGAIGGRAAVMWAYDGADVLRTAEQKRLDKEMDVLGMHKGKRQGPLGATGKDTWPTLDVRIKEAGLTLKQVQAAWMKHVDAGPQKLGVFPVHARALEADIADTLVIARHRFPNLRVVLLSSRTYAGWTGPNAGSPEPYAYETAFSVRWLIERQMQGDPQLNYDATKGEVKSPILLWGPYLWANGDTPRKFDGLVWSEHDVRANDHMHPSESGCKKVAEMLSHFLKTDAGTSRWYVKY
jgi:hypothetical protein